MTRSLSTDRLLRRLAAANPLPHPELADMVRRGPDPRAVLEQILATGPERPAARERRPRRRVALVVAGVVAATSTAAVATGVPESVRHAFGGGASGAQATLVDDARMVGSVQTRGFDFQLWSAPTSDGGSCTYLEVARHGERPDGPVSCTYPHDGGAAPSPALDVGFEDTNPGVESYPNDTVDRGPDAKPLGRDPDAPLVLVGRARPPASVVEIVSGDGPSTRMRLRDGYFLAPLGVDGARGAYRLTARDAHGAVVARRCLGGACRAAAAHPPR